MPTVFRHQGYRFFFYSDEGILREPTHIHVRSGSCEAKFWLRPVVQVAYNRGYSARALLEIEKIIEWNRAQIERYWNDFFA
ncbi:MAG TPA: DUF4160 domain-containing protein [Granulicella sp.]